jgi:hypothetical protein
MASLFERLAQGRPQEPDSPPAPPATPPEALRLLNWIQNNWTKPTICGRDIRRLGPGITRDRESMAKSTEILVKRGWLIPLKMGRYDAKRWQVTIGPT